MKRKRIRALVLTAGHGTRLRPLTLFLPKPLLPVRGEPVVGHTLRRLAAAGCETAVLNLHHLPDAIPRCLGSRYHGLRLLYSPEEEIQGTLGALYPQRQVLAAADVVLVVNGDTWCRWPWKRLIRRHLRSGAAATLLLHRRPPAAELGGGVGVDARGRVVELRDVGFAAPPRRRHVFAGAHVFSRELLERLEPGPGDVVSDLYIPLLRRGGHLDSVVTAAPWYDLGAPERYLEANLAALAGRSLFGRRRCEISPLAEVHETATVVGSVVDDGVRIGEGAHVEGSVVLAGAEVASASRLEHSVVGPGVHLPPAARIENRMICRTRLGYQAVPGESVMGELIYTPLAARSS
ncbi:MAG TPA: NDP-sugar synthase [Thermoanaerobaculia bacterium]